MTERLKNHLAGLWQDGTGTGVTLYDPVLGTPLVEVDATGLELQNGFAFARSQAGPALRAMTYQERGAMLSKIATVLQSHRDQYYKISTANSGTVENDTAVDVDGGIYTLSTYARLGEQLGARRFLFDGEATKLGKDPLFQSQHILSPLTGLALFINAFNFPSWGLWEKAAPALLSGVPVVVKPATATAWLTHQMVQDVIAAQILPPGALSIVCGSSAGLLDALTPFDVLSFTGSAQTGALIRSHRAVTEHSVRVNIEADSLNSALLLPGDAETLDLLVKEVSREMTVKSGQKCTAIRRVFVPEALYDKVAQAICARLQKITVGNPRNNTVRMGSLVSREQYQAVVDGIGRLSAHADLLFDGRNAPLVDADPAIACCVGPVLLGCLDPEGRPLVHDLEVFGPVATLMPYKSLSQATALIARGQGSLVISAYGKDPAALAEAATTVAAYHGRVHVISPDVASIQTGHGNVMPQSIHGGPGRAGGGEELGGLRALQFYHQRTALQASTEVLAAL
jgi:3,4-dehydroadipyl-CoA semialdehyde dehydrogenase